MHRNHTNSMTSRNEITARSDHSRKRVLVCASTDTEEQWRLAERASQDSLTFVRSAVDLKRLRDNGTAQFDTVILNQVFEPDWAEPVLLAWSLLADGGRLLAVVPQDSDRDRSQNARAAQKLIGQFGRTRRPSRRARQAGIPTHCSILVCTKRGSRTANWWQRALRLSR